MSNPFIAVLLTWKELRQQSEPWTKSPVKLSQRKSLQLSSINTNTEQFVVFFNWDSLHARLNSHYKAWSYKKKKHKKIKA